MVKLLGRTIAVLVGRFIINLTKTIMIVPRGACRFHPSCSEYAIEALKTMPLHKASYKIINRILRCNPIAKGGYDPLN